MTFPNYTCEAPYTPEGLYTQLSCFTRTAGALHPYQVAHDVVAYEETLAGEVDE